MADQAVRSREGVSRAVEFLLARTAIVRDMEDAVALARRAGYSFRIVTLLGDIVNPGGVMTGGSIQKKQFGLLSRERDIEKLEELLKQKAGQAGQAERALAQSKKESEKLQQQAEAILLELKAGEIQAAQQRSQTEADAQQLSLLQNQMAEMEARLSGASRQSEENRQKIAELSAYLEELSQKTLAAREEGEPVSYTHLDVYKRQTLYYKTSGSAAKGAGGAGAGRYAGSGAAYAGAYAGRCMLSGRGCSFFGGYALFHEHRPHRSARQQ